MFLNKCSLLAAFVLLEFYSTSQPNLVPNSSFEDSTGCTTMQISNINYCKGWFDASLGTCDYTYDCNGHPLFFYGSQIANSGDSYMGFIAYTSYCSSCREYMASELKYTLQQGKKYLVSFYINLADGSCLNISRIGAYLAKESDNIPQSILNDLGFSPQVYNPTQGVLNNKTSWVKVEDTIVASGNEKYIIIGNFDNDSNSNPQWVGCSNPLDSIAYYIVDDVSVVPLEYDAIAGSDNVICNGDQCILGKSNTYNSSCLITWSPSLSLDNPNQSNPIASPDTTTTYILTISGCGATVTDTVTVFVEDCPVEEIEVNIYPNPSDGNFEIKYTSGAELKMIIYNSIGQRVVKENLLP
ncbi:MAG: hypothetical protein ACOZCO_11695, partial [Bacteroidota bacterium]